MRKELLYLWGLAFTCLAFEIAGLIFTFLNSSGSGQGPLFFPFTLTGFFVAWMMFTNFIMQRGFAQGDPVKAARLGWYWAVIGGAMCAVAGWHSLTHFSSGLLAGYVTLYAMLFLFVCWGLSCFIQYAEQKRIRNSQSSSPTGN
jgi:hypothetical protein